MKGRQERFLKMKKGCLSSLIFFWIFFLSFKTWCQRSLWLNVDGTNLNLLSKIIPQGLMPTMLYLVYGSLHVHHHRRNCLQHLHDRSFIHFVGMQVCFRVRIRVCVVHQVLVTTDQKTRRALLWCLFACQSSLFRHHFIMYNKMNRLVLQVMLCFAYIFGQERARRNPILEHFV